MYANYHTHTPRCHHASGCEREYIECARTAGMRILGFSDHTPYPFTDGYVSHIRMLPEELDGYCSTLLALKKEYSSTISLHIGLEAEYFPKYFSEYRTMLKDQPVEYLILGQHYIPDEPGIYSGAETTDTGLLYGYCRQCMEAMQTGIYTYIAHPDLINFVGDREIYRKAMGEMIREAMSCGMPAEINLLGLSEGRHYPGRSYLEILAENNCPVIIGCDAHTPEQLLPSSPLNTAKEMIAEYGLKLVDTVDLRPIF